MSQAKHRSRRIMVLWLAPTLRRTFVTNWRNGNFLIGAGALGVADVRSDGVGRAPARPEGRDSWRGARR